MKHLYDAGGGPKVFLISRQLEERFCTTSVQQFIKDLLVTVDERVEFVGQGEDYMEIGGIYNFSPSFVDPDLFVNCLAVRAVTVAAGIVMDPGIAAVRTKAYVITKAAGPACKDCSRCFFLDI